MSSDNLNIRLEELIVRQVYALVRETAEILCPEAKDCAAFEIRLLDIVAVNMAGKRDMFKQCLAQETSDIQEEG